LKESSETVLIESSHIRNLTASKITAGTINAHEIILKQQGAQTTISAPANMAILRSSDYNGSYNNSTNQWTAGTSGWVIAGNGYAEFSSASIRGGIKAGSVWIDANNRWNRNAADTANVTEFRAGSSTKYLYFDGTNLTFTGNLSAAGGTFSGSLSAATGTFSGALSAASGTFAGDLVAVGGTFEGDISAASGTFTGNLSGSTITGGSINIGSGTFRVNSSGQITASSGTIGGWTVSSSGFSGSGGSLMNHSGDANFKQIVIQNVADIEELNITGTGIQYSNYANNRVALEWEHPDLLGIIDGGTQVLLGTLSDRKTKENISEPLRLGNYWLNKVYNDVKIWEYVPYNHHKEDFTDIRPRLGVIADEVEKVFPELVPSGNQTNGEVVYKGFNYSGLTPILTLAIQDLNKRLIELEQRISDLE